MFPSPPWARQGPPPPALPVQSTAGGGPPPAPQVPKVTPWQKRGEGPGGPRAVGGATGGPEDPSRAPQVPSSPINGPLATFAPVLTSVGSYLGVSSQGRDREPGQGPRRPGLWPQPGPPRWQPRTGHWPPPWHLPPLTGCCGMGVEQTGRALGTVAALEGGRGAPEGLWGCSS